MALLVGVLLGVAVGLLGTVSGMDRDRAFYPVATIVIASYYALFAVMGGTSRALAVEMLIGLVFLVAAVWGFKSSLWIVVAAMAGHGLMDAVHGSLVANDGVPVWWPLFCGSIDITLAAYLGVVLWRQRHRAAGPGGMSSVPTG